jgi:hypothetical protein
MLCGVSRGYIQLMGAPLAQSGELDLAEFSSALLAMAAGEWQTVLDPASGKTYYYHKTT